MLYLSRVLLIAIASLLSSTFIKAQSWKSLADTALQMKKQSAYSLSLQLYRQARSVVEKDSGQTTSSITLSHNIADIYTIQGFYDTAIIEYANARLAVLKMKVVDSALLGVNYNQTGITFFGQGNYDSSRYFFEQALFIRKTIYNVLHTDYAASCLNLANVYKQTGDYTKARSLYFEALDIKAKTAGTNSLEYARVCNNLADFYRELGEFEKAESMAILAKQIRGEYKDKQPDVYAISCTNLANLYTELGQYHKAELNYKEAKDLREKVFTKNSPGYAASCNILADYYAVTKDYEKAKILFYEALEIRSKVLSTNHRDYAQTCNNIGGLYLNTGDIKNAKKYLSIAREVWIKALKKNDPAININLALLAVVYRLDKDFQAAEKAFKEVLYSWKMKYGDLHPEYLDALRALARLYWDMDRREDAAALYQQSLTASYQLIQKIFRFSGEREKEQYIENISGSGEEILSYHLQKGDKNKSGTAFQAALQHRNLILSSGQKIRQIIFEKNDSLLNQQYNRWMVLKQKLSHLYSKNSESSSELSRITEEANVLEKEISKRSQEFKSLQENDDWRKIRNSLKTNEVAIEFAYFKLFDGKRWCDSTYYVAFILKRDLPEPKMIFLFEEKQLDSILYLPEDVNAITNFYKRGVEEEHAYSNTRSSVYNLIWRPIEKDLKGASVVYFAPAGKLYRIAFAALTVSDRYLLSDLYQLVQLNATTGVLSTRTNSISKNSTVNLFGGIIYDKPGNIAHTSPLDKAFIKRNSRGGAFNYLSGTKKEVDQISQMAKTAGFNVKSSSGNTATEELFKSLTGKNSPGVLHVATHGFVFEQPLERDSNYTPANSNAFKRSVNPFLRSGLLFAGANEAWQGRTDSAGDDGILTAYEVTNLLHFPNTKLLVLSACETALGDIKGTEGVYGLQRAFKMAGVENLVMSLWEVPDEETVEFMQAFYRSLFTEQSIDSSFRHAQTIMKKKYRNDPFKWAAWVLVK